MLSVIISAYNNDMVSVAYVNVIISVYINFNVLS